MTNYSVCIDYDTSKPSTDLRSYRFTMEESDDAVTDGLTRQQAMNTHRLVGVFSSEAEAAQASLDYVGFGKIYRIESDHFPRYVLSQFPPKVGVTEKYELVTS